MNHEEISFAYLHKINKIKSLEAQIKASKSKNQEKSLENIYSSVRFNEKSYLYNSCYQSGDEFSKLFGSSIYNPSKSSMHRSKLFDLNEFHIK